MSSGDGVVRRTHPILAAFIGDYPEQVLVCCCKTSNCPKCIIERDEIGESEDPSPLRDLNAILSALGKLDNGPLAFIQACQEVGIKPVIQPFWQDLPYVNIYLSITPDILHQLYQGVYLSITPDILHQLYQGVMKHLIAWIKAIYGSAELDARCCQLPPNHGTLSSQWQGTCWHLPNPTWVNRWDPSSEWLPGTTPHSCSSGITWFSILGTVSHAHIVDADTASKCSETISWQQGHLCRAWSTIAFQTSKTPLTELLCWFDQALWHDR